LVGIGCNICDELLSCKSKKASKARVCLGWRREPSFRKIVVGNGIRNLGGRLDMNLGPNRASHYWRIVIHFREELLEGGIFSSWELRLWSWRKGIDFFIVILHRNKVLTWVRRVCIRHYF
jgi:hypothetical protein